MQLHFHWGRQTGEGSEHVIDGESTELEVHMVTVMQGSPDINARDLYSVIGVFAYVDEDAPVDGVWATLNTTIFQDFEAGTQQVTGVELDAFLPEDRDYYYYEGSLTTPPCNETVNWFVLKGRISVPGAYLDQLRQVAQNAAGDPLTFNFRDPQPLQGRRVTTPSSQAIIRPLLSLLLLCSIMATLQLID